MGCHQKLWLSLFFHQWIPSGVIFHASSLSKFYFGSECQLSFSVLLADRTRGILASFSWKLLPWSLWVLFLEADGLCGRTIWVCLLQIKALTPYLGPCKNFLKYFEIRPFYLHLESPVSPAYRSRGWWTHKTKGKGELCISSPSPKIPLKSLWSVPSGIMQIAWGNPKIVFSPDKHLGQRKELCVPSQWTEFCLNLEKSTKKKDGTQHVCSTLRNRFQRISNREQFSRAVTASWKSQTPQTLGINSKSLRTIYEISKVLLITAYYYSYHFIFQQYRITNTRNLFQIVSTRWKNICILIMLIRGFDSGVLIYLLYLYVIF